MERAAREKVKFMRLQFTDILGARRLGIHAILVSPLSDSELPHTRLKRRIERFLLGRRDDS